MNINQVFENNKKWIAEKLAGSETFFEDLAKGQSPAFLYIGCSDSRVTAEAIMGAEPGDVFVHRNIANQVVLTDNNINSVVHYAVEHLKVKHIVVCGHYECGGIKAAMNPSDLGQLNSWLQSLRDVARTHKDELDSIADDQKRFDRLVELNVKEQCLNMMKMDHVQKARKETGSPSVHGWVFNVRTGELIDLGLDIDKEFQELESIYSLNS